MKVRNISTATTTVISDNVCPELLVMNVVAGAVTRVRVNIAGIGYIADVTGTALQALTGNARMNTPLLADIGKLLMLPLGDGYHGNKRTEIEITTTGASVNVDVYYLNTDKGSFFIRTRREKCYANQPSKFEKFTQVAFMVDSVDEQVNVVYMNGTQHTGTVFEFNALNTRQSASNFLLYDKICVVDNDEQWIKSVEYIPSVDTEAFVTEFFFHDMDEVEQKLVKMAQIAEKQTSK
jgi:hypothetical protein